MNKKNYNRSRYMALALQLAAKAGEKTYPNPMVGAVIVKNGKIIGKGYHRKAGERHAEINAIRSVVGDCIGAEMYVTLEPCSHYGKTPPCTDAIVASGINRVYIAMIDPNPITSRVGIRILKKAGIKVEVGIRMKEAEELNEKYIKYIKKGLPYITVKLAQSIDGKIAARNGTSKWITSERSRKYAGKLRGRFNGIMIGSNTAKKDDPSLLSSGRDKSYTSRIVLDSTLGLSLDCNLVSTAGTAPLIIATTEKASLSRIKKFNKIKGVEVLSFKGSKGKVPIIPLLKKLHSKGIVSLMVEGGGELVGSFLEKSLIDEWMFFIAPKVLGGLHTSIKGKGVSDITKILDLDCVENINIGGDIFLRAKTCSRV